MSSFYQLYESSKAGKDFWFGPPTEEVGLEIIQRGLEVHADRTDGNTFWDDFIAVFGQNTEEAAKLLGVSRDRIARWPQRIRKVMDMVRQQNMGEEEKAKQKKKTMLPTGI